VAHSLHDAGDDIRFVRLFDGFLLQTFQELLDFPFDLTRGPCVTLFIARFKQVRQLDHPFALTFQSSIWLGIVLADGREVEQRRQEGMPPFF